MTIFMTGDFVRLVDSTDTAINDRFYRHNRHLYDTPPDQFRVNAVNSREVLIDFFDRDGNIRNWYVNPDAITHVDPERAKMAAKEAVLRKRAVHMKRVEERNKRNVQQEPEYDVAF